MYSCPGCGSNIKYDIEAGMMKCENCSNTYDPYSLTDSGEAVNSDSYNVMVFTCPQCGGEIMTEDNEVAAFCSYCGSSAILAGRLESAKKPKYIIPFAKTKTDCAKAFKNKMSKALFAPSELKTVENINNFKGIYMPYWIYSFMKKDTVTVKATRKYRRGDYDYTDHFDVTSNVAYDYSGVCFDASSTFDDSLSQSIAPYDTTKKKDFSPAFLSGFYADKEDVAAEVYIENAQEAITANVSAKFQKDPAFHGKMVDKKSMDKAMKGSCYSKEMALLPVWFLAYRHGNINNEERVSYMVVNGQTGQIDGDVPIAISKFFLSSAILSLILFVIFNAAFTITPTSVVVVSIIVMILAFIIYLSQTKKINARETGIDDAGKIYASNIDFKKSKAEGKFRANWIFAIIAGVLSVLVLFFHPVSDIWYYLVAIMSAGVTIGYLVTIIRRYNLTTTWKLPQFNRKGGNDNAVYTEEI